MPNFCSTCGTKLFLAFERFPVALGVYAGTFDNPNWFARIPKLSKHIFLSSAQDGTVIPPGINTYVEHEILNDGTPTAPTTFEQPHTIDQPGWARQPGGAFPCVEPPHIRGASHVRKPWLT